MGWIYKLIHTIQASFFLSKDKDQALILTIMSIKDPYPGFEPANNTSKVLWIVEISW
jgi:hypothetical protein